MFLRKTHYNFSSLFMNFNRKSIHPTMRTRKPWKKNKYLLKKIIFRIAFGVATTQIVYLLHVQGNGLFTLPNIDVSHLKIIIWVSKSSSYYTVFWSVIDQRRWQKSKIENDQRIGIPSNQIQIYCVSRGHVPPLKIWWLDVNISLQGVNRGIYPN